MRSGREGWWVAINVPVMQLFSMGNVVVMLEAMTARRRPCFGTDDNCEAIDVSPVNKHTEPDIHICHATLQ